MRDAGILDGDFAVVEASENAQAGDFVVALVDGEYTLKELQFEKRQPVLVPWNPAYQVLRPKTALEIRGVVVGIVRRYRGGTDRRCRRADDDNK